MFERPHNTTANPLWPYAQSPVDLIPTCDDWTGQGERMLAYFGGFTLTQGAHAGKRLAEVIAPWQAAMIRYIFGRRDANGEKIVRRVFLKIGKGSAKTTTAAAITVAVVMDSADREVNLRAQVALMAASIASANLCYQHITECVQIDPDLRGLFSGHVQFRTLTHVGTGIETKVLAPELRAAIGLRPVLTIIDELHAAALECADMVSVLDQLRKGGANWGSEALEIIITTAPPKRAYGAYLNELSYARKVRDGEIEDPSYLPILFEWPARERPDLNLRDVSEWWRGMPSLGITMPAEEMARELRDAEQRGGEAFASLLSQRLGIEPDDRVESITDAILKTRWKDVPTRSRQVPKGLEEIFVAVDPGGVDDPQAVAILWCDPDTHREQVIVEQHIARSGYNRADEALRAIYDEAIKCGELVVHEQVSAIDNTIGERVEALQEIVSVVVLGGDAVGRHGAVSTLVKVTGLEFQGVPQGWQQGASIAMLEGLILDEVIDVTRGPLLDANVANVTIDRSGPSPRLRKDDAGMSGQGSRKIDGLTSLLSVLALREQHRAKNPTVDVGAMCG